MILRPLPPIGSPDIARAVRLALPLLESENAGDTRSHLSSEQQGPLGRQHRRAETPTAAARI